ncbi:MAG: hypothetical protein M0R17_07335 [Candidatus Omnitrophica bacterium]|jgi:hypothetical protein|nr:hypothetical protein [Candidatus Omnitrophota bacterium]
MIDKLKYNVEVDNSKDGFKYATLNIFGEDEHLVFGSPSLVIMFDEIRFEKEGWAGVQEEYIVLYKDGIQVAYFAITNMLDVTGFCASFKKSEVCKDIPMINKFLKKYSYDILKTIIEW